MPVKLLAQHHSETLSLTDACTGSSESTLVKMPHCWKSLVMAHTVSHFSYAPLLNVKLLIKDICNIYSETTSLKRIYICISHRNFIVIRRVTSEKMDLEGRYPQNTISHCIISNETQITLHFFQGRISEMPEIRADLFLAISKTGMCLLTLSDF